MSIRPSTREALIAGARAVLAETGAEVPVSTITERAGVAVGSFYNHFESKTQLLREAAQSALTEWEDYMIQRTSAITDPVERFGSRLRLMGRMGDIRPDIARIFVNAGPRALAMPMGYSPRAVPDVAALVDHTGVPEDDLELRLTMIVAAGEKLIRLRLSDPSIPPERADDLTETLLTFMGVEPERAREVARQPLPPEQA